MMPTHGTTHGALQRRLQIFDRLASAYDIAAQGLENIQVASLTQGEAIAVPPLDHSIERPDVTQLGQRLHGFNGLGEVQDKGG
jgi:hypothetical protein